VNNNENQICIHLDENYSRTGAETECSIPACSGRDEARKRSIVFTTRKHIHDPSRNASGDPREIAEIPVLR
jgi:hypothetical protein